MEPDFENGICFSSDIANRLNDLAFQIDRRIFLFAYYEPKPYRENESWYSRFCTAVVNLYGLLKDCGPFLGAVLNYLSKHFGARDICDEYHQLLPEVSAFRSILCHNCSRELQLDEEHYSCAEAYVRSHAGVDLALWDLEPTHWEALLLALDTSAGHLVNGLEAVLNEIILSSNAAKRNDIVKHWITKIAGSYQRNPNYLLHTMASLYQWYLENGGARPSCRPNTSLRNQTIKWLRELYADDPDKK